MSTPMSPAMSMPYVHTPSRMKQSRNPPSAMSESEAASPSMPSMRLMALVMNTMMKTVSGAPIQKGIS